MTDDLVWSVAEVTRCREKPETVKGDWGHVGSNEGGWDLGMGGLEVAGKLSKAIPRKRGVLANCFKAARMYLAFEGVKT